VSAPNVYCALVHFPVRDRAGDTVTSSVTNIDVHDLARSCRTYGLCGFFVVTPITAQRALVARILEHWDSPAGQKRMPERGEALSLCASAASVDEVIAVITEREGAAPRLVTTSAREEGGRPVHSYAEESAAIASSSRPTLLLFGTGHGLQKVLVDRSDALLAPIRPGSYNHLSVRAAAAITLDRLFGDGPAPT
jgi:hypothetical protein